MSKNLTLTYGWWPVRFFMITAILLTSFIIPDNGAHARQSSLVKIHQKIERKYPTLRHLDGDEFTKLTADKPLIFDVRKPKEYAVSHIEGAVQIDPDMDGQTFMSRYGDLIEDKKIVFYCSVGRRSSLMASRVMAQLEPNERARVFNLKSGIFHWRNESRPLKREDEATKYVHPYNFYWGRLIEDRAAIRYKP